MRADVARREVADHAHTRVVHGPHDAVGLGGAVQLEVGVDRSQAVGEAAAKLRVIVELAQGPDVELDTVQQRELVAELLLQRADLRGLRQQGLA